MRVVLSSRPKELNGVDASRFRQAPTCLNTVHSSPTFASLAMRRHFVIMNLKELTAEQQHEAVSHQLKEADDFTHLAAFGEIRQKHDDIYREVAFKEETQRHDIETFEQPNKFFKDGTRDPHMRQRRRDGAGFVRVSTALGPQSAYLQVLCEFFSDAVLAELQDRLVTGLAASPDEAAIKSAVQQLQSSDEVRQLRERHGDGLFELEDNAKEEDATRREALKSEEAFAGLKQAAKLGLLLVKRRDKEPSLTAAMLWERVWRATDEVYVATEDLKPVPVAHRTLDHQEVLCACEALAFFNHTGLRGRRGGIRRRAWWSGAQVWPA